MKEINKILVPLDGSKNSFRALEKAIYLAKVCSATITAISVLPNLPVTGIHDVMSTRKKFLKETKSFLSMAKKRAAQQGVSLNEKISYGNPGVEITKFAKDKKFDEIVIGSRGWGATKAALFGSVSNYVMHNASAPVLVVK